MERTYDNAFTNMVSIFNLWYEMKFFLIKYKTNIQYTVRNRIWLSIARQLFNRWYSKKESNEVGKIWEFSYYSWSINTILIIKRGFLNGVPSLILRTKWIFNLICIWHFEHSSIRDLFVQLECLRGDYISFS